MRVAGLAKAVDLLEGKTLLVDEALCLNLRGRAVSCEACSARCPVKAFSLTADAIELDEASCTRCGACVPVCPAGVMRLSGFGPARFLEALDGQPEVHLHCSASVDGGGGVVIPCYHVLDARLLAALADGTRTFVMHGVERCGDCPKGEALNHIQQVEAVLNEWFDGETPKLRPAQPGEQSVAVERKNEDQTQMSRRGFLCLAGARAVTSTAGWLLPAEEAEDAAVDLPFYQADADINRPVPLQALLAERVTQLPWENGLPRPWRSRTLSDDCSACFVCTQRCPTGALRGTETDAARMITFEAALCTDCGLCEKLCPEHAVWPRPALSLDEVTAARTVLIHRAMNRCRGCGHSFLPATPRAEWCQVCQNERELDDEWLAMLEG